jgi:hypothetical protein
MNQGVLSSVTYTIVSLKITNSMELSPSWEAACRSASQEFSNMLQNQKVYYCVYKSFSGPCAEPDQSSQYNHMLSL